MHHEIESVPPRRRRRAAVAIFFVVVAATLGAAALVGGGGPAAWTATDAGSSSTNSGTGTAVRLQHLNTVDGVGCTSRSDGQPMTCRAIMNITVNSESAGVIYDDRIAGPDAHPVFIQNTSTQPAGFTVGLVTASNAGGPDYCSDLTLTISDGEPSPAVIYSGTATTAAFGSARSVLDGAGHQRWPVGGGNAFHFMLRQGGGQADDNGGTCTLTVTWTQQ